MHPPNSTIGLVKQYIPKTSGSDTQITNTQIRISLLTLEVQEGWSGSCSAAVADGSGSVAAKIVAVVVVNEHMRSPSGPGWVLVSGQGECIDDILTFSHVAWPPYSSYCGSCPQVT